MASEVKSKQGVAKGSPGKVALHRAVIFVTTYCNFRCGFCEFAADTLPKERKIHFPRGRWTLLLSELKDLGCKEIYLTGGEPLMHPQFWDMVEEAKAADLPVHRITTNGSVARTMGEREFQLAREAVRAIQVSVDSPFAEVHDKSRGFEGAFDKLSDFIVMLRSNGVRTHISNVVTRETFNQCRELVEWSHGIGAEHVNFQPVNWEANYGDYAPVKDKVRFQIPTEEMEALDRSLREANEVAVQLNVTTNIPLMRTWVRAFFECQGSDEYFHDRVMSNFRCYVPHTTVYIGSDGEVFPCTLINRVGSLHRESLAEIWHGSMQRVRNYLDQGKFYPECRSCYCDFPSNVRSNLKRHPAANFGFALKTLTYYTNRLRTH